MDRLIELDKSVVVAADISSSQLKPLVKATAEVPGISSYKVGAALGLEMSLSQAVNIIKTVTSCKVIYDHQKAGTDIPETAIPFMRVLQQAGIDAVILFPLAGPKTQEAWTKAAQDAGLTVLVGGHMTHPEFIERDGGYVRNGAPHVIYEQAVQDGVRDFVVPGNQVDLVKSYRRLIESLIGDNHFALYAPGFITQGGEISKFAQEAGENWHAIVGSAIYKAADIRAAAQQMTAQLR